MKRIESIIAPHFRFWEEGFGTLFKQSPLFRHCLFFTALVLVIASDERIVGQNPKPFWESLLVSLFLYTICAVHNLILFERFLLRKHFLLYAIFLLFLIFSASWLFLQLPMYRLSLELEEPHLTLWQQFYITIWGTASNVIVGFGIYFVYRYYFKIQQERLQYELLLREKELNALKAQINPHFLFNSLNALYATVLETPDAASEHILQLAHLMRYQLENGTNETVKLSDEIAFLHDFIALEKNRIGKRCRITAEFDIPQEYRRNISIPPLLLLPLIENAIKYGTASSAYNADNPAIVSILLKQTPTNLLLETRNSITARNNGNSPTTTLPSTKIGLENLRKRLQYLYGTQATLETLATPTHFSARLVIPLK
jgi:two-component system LytT family sensor kinase